MTTISAFTCFLLTLALINTGMALECYVCIGYDSAVADNSITNNRNCPADSFDGSKLVTKTTNSTDKMPMCSAFILHMDGQSLTLRGASSYVKTKTNALRQDMDNTLCGYSCNTNLCNSKDPNASAVPALLLPLLPLLVIVTRSLA